jgi:hypothetical protein
MDDALLILLITIQWLMSKPELARRLQRCALKIQEKK